MPAPSPELRGTLGSFRALKNAAIALGDHMAPVDAGGLLNRVELLSFDLSASQRLALAELLDDVAQALGRRGSSE